MKVKVEVDCTAAEARAFLGLPDVSSLNRHMVQEMKSRMDRNLAALSPDEILRSWMSFGGQASEQFRRLMSSAAGAANPKP